MYFGMSEDVPLLIFNALAVFTHQYEWHIGITHLVRDDW